MQQPLFSAAQPEAPDSPPDASAPPRVENSPRGENAVPLKDKDLTDTSDPGAPVWLQRLSLFVLVMFCVYLGVIVAVIPWYPRMWDQNGWMNARPELAAILHTGWVRGIVSGLGLLDIWIGISEVMHYRDHRV